MSAPGEPGGTTLPAAALLAAVTLAALTALAAYDALYFFPVTVDDTFISLRYAWNLAHGEGLVFNPGERVEGYSNPSWTVIAAAFIAAGVEPLVALKWLGVACAAAVPVLAWWSARQLGLGHVWALLPAALCAVDLNIAFWAPNGLETPLWTVLVAVWPGLLARRWTLGERVPVSAIVGALLYVSRPEAPLFIAPAILVEVVRAWRAPALRRSAIAWAATLGVPCLAWLGFRAVYYGDWVANTYYVKASGGWQTKAFQQYLASWLGVNAPMTAVILTLSAPFALRSRGGRIAVAALAIQFLFVLRAGGDWMAQNRFWVPAVPLAALVIATGTRGLATLLRERGQRHAEAIVAGAVALLLLPQAWRHLTLELLYIADDGAPVSRARWGGNQKTVAERVAGPFRTGVPERVAKVLTHIPDGAVIAHSEIGLLAYASDNPVLDGYALVDKRLSGATGEAVDDVLESLTPPDYLLMREQVGLLAKMRKTTWYAERGFAERHRWQNVWLEAPGPVPELPPDQAFARLDRAVDRVPRDLTFHLARIELARTVGDREREARYCAEVAAAMPTFANLCQGGGAPAPKPNAVAFRAFYAQSTNPGFEGVEGDALVGWTPVPGDATAYGAAAEGAFAGDRALRVTGSQWVCAPWEPVKGDIRVVGVARAVDVTGAKNERQGAAVNLRIRMRDTKTEEYPVLQAWSGDTAWTPFALTWPAKPEYTEYRACLGLNNAQGTALFDEVRAGSEDAPEGADGAVTGAPPVDATAGASDAAVHAPGDEAGGVAGGRAPPPQENEASKTGEGAP